MKVGLFITGHLRDAPKTYENYRQFLQGHDTSVYVATWSSYDIDRNTHQLMLNDINASDILQNIFGSSLKRMWIGDIEKFVNNKSPLSGAPPRQIWPEEFLSKTKNTRFFTETEGVVWPQRVLDQWYVVKEAYKLCSFEEYNSFDVCIRIRGDQNFIGKPPIPFANTEDGFHVNGFWWTDVDTYDNTGLIPFRLSDQLGWGKPKWMKKYFEYYDHFLELFLPLLEKTDKEFHFGSEHMFCYYMLRYPYFRKDLNPNDINDHDMKWHRHGHNQIIRDGRLIHDYYELASKGNKI